MQQWLAIRTGLEMGATLWVVKMAEACVLAVDFYM